MMLLVQEPFVAPPKPEDMLWRYLKGEFPCFLEDDTDRVGWVKYRHRGVQRLDRIEIPRKQRRYILTDRFQMRVNQAFEEVIRACADPGREDGRTWITPELVECFIGLHRMGFAYSFEAWQDGRLAGGLFGVQIGRYISVESMFHRVSNSSKAAYGQLLLRLRDRGFALVDTGGVSDHLVNYGEQWMPQWEFESFLREAVNQPLTIDDSLAPAILPWRMLLRFRVHRLTQAVGRRLRRRAALGSVALSLLSDWPLPLLA